MLVAMKKVGKRFDLGISYMLIFLSLTTLTNAIPYPTDGDLFDALRDQFRQLDMTGDGIITKKDLTIMATRKMKKISHKLELSDYKVPSPVL